MIRFVLRILGLWLVALALVALVIDATASIAASALVFTPAGKYWFDLDPASLGLAQAAVQRHLSPMLWDPVIQSLLEAPVWAVSGPLGFLLLWLGDLGRRRRRRGDALLA